MATACILRDRYVNNLKQRGNVRSRLPLLVIILSAFLALMMIIFDSAYVGSLNSPPTESFDDSTDTIIQTLVALEYVRDVFYLIGGIFLLGFCIHLRRYATSDLVS
jgi:hypothetical protein